MERNDVLVKLQEIIGSAVDDEDIVLNDNTVATDIEGWDSIAQVLIMGEIQNELGVKFTSSEINNLANVGELVDSIISKL